MTKEEKNIIKVNRVALTSKKVREQENVDSILNKHKNITKRPIYKQRKFYLALFLVFIVALLMYYADKEEKEKEIQKRESIN